MFSVLSPIIKLIADSDRREVMRNISQNDNRVLFYRVVHSKLIKGIIVGKRLEIWKKYFDNEQIKAVVFGTTEVLAVINPKADWIWEYDNFYDGIKDNKTIKITWGKSDEHYLIIPSVKNDPILNKYGLDAGFSHFVLRFQKNDLIDFGGYKINENMTHYFSSSDFYSDIKNEKLRILQAPILALYTPGLFVKGLRERGYKADQMIFDESGFGWLIEEKPDFNLEVESAPIEVNRARKMEFLVYALKNYDIMHFHSNWSLLGWDSLWTLNGDMFFLKKMGKKIVDSSWGMCDVTLYNDSDNFNWISECDVCIKLREERCENREYSDIIKNTRKQADALLMNGRGVVAYPKMIWIDNAIDVDKYLPGLKKNIPAEFLLPSTDNLRIYHSFGNSEDRDDVKGTKYIKEAVERLQREGYSVEFMFFDNVSHLDLRYYQIQADVIIDQLYCGWYGSTGTECLALGLPVITYVNPEVEAFLKERGRNIPVISATTDSIYDTLKLLLDNRKILDEMRLKAREYAEKYHDYRVLTDELIDIYEKI